MMTLMTDSRLFFRRQLRGVVGMPIGATVFRLRTELIFIECWNLITPGCEAGHSSRGIGRRRFGPGRLLGRRQGSDKTEGHPTTMEACSGAGSRPGAVAYPPGHYLAVANVAAVPGRRVTSAGADRSQPAALGRARQEALTGN